MRYPPRVRRARLLSFVGISASAVACSLITDLDGLKSGVDASTSDASDASPPMDARADARDATAPLDSAMFCMTRDADFCADFDESANLQTGWDNYLSYGGPALTETTAQFVSAPRAIHAGIATSVADAGFLKVYSNLAKGFPLGSKTHVRIEADVRFESATYSPSDYTQYFSWVAQSTMGGTTVGVTGVVRTGSNGTDGWAIAVATTGPIAYFPMTTPPPENKWTHMVVDVVLGTSGSVAASFDGKTALNPANVGTATSTPTYVGVVVGYASPSGNSPAVGMTCDNVVVTLLP